MFWLVLLLIPFTLHAQSALPFFIGRPIIMLPPAVDGSGQRVVFGSAITLDGVTFPTTDLYIAAADGTGLRRLTRLAGDFRPPQGATAVSFSADGSRAAFTAFLTGPERSSEEVHVIDTATGADRTVVVDKEGCVQPLGCPNCFFTCVNTPHLSPDGAKVLYMVSRDRKSTRLNSSHRL